MRIKGLICFFAGLTLIFMAAFCKDSIETSEIKHYPLDNLEGIITRSDVRIDKEITSDGNGSLCISANKPATVRLYETGDIDIENSQLIYQARVRTEGVEGRVYIEMLCHFPGKGEFFSRALQSPLSGSKGWTTQETPFFLKKGENPDNIKINLVVEGKGKVWIDDIRLIKGKLLSSMGGDMEENDSGPSFRIPIFNTETGRVEKIERIVKSNSEWKKILTSEQYRIMREKGTEAPFTGKCEIGEPGGIYKCVACGTDLFRVDEKFESGTGWPSFWEPVSGLNIREEHDDSHGMERTEVLCARCDGHLGHVFNDGPAPTYKRYCINAAALKFIPAQKKGLGLEKAVFAAGCFWGVEETFRQTKGVISTQAGYTGGHTKDPAYEAVCTDRTGHAEAVLVEYDPSVISYEELLTIFWTMHNPTTFNRQGPDIGSQYRSAIFYFDESQRRSAIASMEKIQAAGKYKDRIVTEIVPVTAFYPAEDYHQKYYMKRKNPSCSQ